MPGCDLFLPILLINQFGSGWGGGTSSGWLTFPKFSVVCTIGEGASVNPKVGS